MKTKLHELVIIIGAIAGIIVAIVLNVIQRGNL